MTENYMFSDLIDNRNISLKLRPHTDGDGVVTYLIIIPHFSFFKNFPTILQQVEGPFMAETLIGDFGEFHFISPTFSLTSVHCNNLYGGF